MSKVMSKDLEEELSQKDVIICELQAQNKVLGEQLEKAIGPCFPCHERCEHRPWEHLAELQEEVANYRVGMREADKQVAALETRARIDEQVIEGLKRELSRLNDVLSAQEDESL